MTHPRAALVVLVTALLLSGCVATFEKQLDRDLQQIGQTLRPALTEARPSETAVVFDGKLTSYLAYAMKNSPALRAAFDEWRAATHVIAQRRKLPEPQVSYALYVQHVETRVGPQRHRFGLSQAFPWPTKLTAAADAASMAARAKQRHFDALALAIKRRLASAYWKLWLLARLRKIHVDQVPLLEHLAAVVRVRLEVGEATLAQVVQIHFKISSLRDEVAAFDEQMATARAALTAAVGAPPGSTITVGPAAPPLILPAEDDKALDSALGEHPRLRAIALMADAQKQAARSAEAEGYPAFVLGLTVIETGEAAMPNVDESGKDPVIVQFGVRVPLWRGAYEAKEKQARAQSAAYLARRAAALDAARFQLAKASARIRDAVRRAALYRTTLIPQAKTVYDSLLTSYAVGRATIANVVISQNDLLELQLGLHQAQADHAIAWAHLEETVGRQVRAKEVGK